MAEANWLTLKYEDFSEFSNFIKTFSSALWCWKMGNRRKSANVTFIRNESICKINSRKMWLNFHLFGLYSEKTLKDTIWFRKVINFRELLLFSTQWSLSLSVLVRWRPNILTIHHFLLVLIPFLNLHSQFNYSFGPKLSLRIV